MSLVGFKAEDHPQQVTARTANLEKDERYTPFELISTLHARWRFTVDAAGVAIAPASKLIGRFWTREQDGLAQTWVNERVWINPPFSSIPPWVEKTWKSEAQVVVMLIPANRTEQPFWHQLIEPYRDRPNSVLRTAFLPKRATFGTPDAPDGKQWNSSAPFGCVILAWNFAAAHRLTHAAKEPADERR